MSAREEILGRVSAALNDVPRSAAAAVAAVPEAQHPAGVARLFVERVRDYRAAVTRVRADGLPEALATALGDARRIVVPAGLPGEWLVALEDVEVLTDGGDRPTLSTSDLDTLDGVVTAAALGIAETGTVVLDHRPDQGRRALSLVPDLHLCVVREEQLVADVPDAMAPLGAAFAAGRPLTWISGPSATSDIELERVEGVHGPRTLHVLLWERRCAQVGSRAIGDGLSLDPGRR